MAKAVQCPDCSSTKLKRIHEFKFVSFAAGGGTDPDNPIGRLIALECGVCKRRIEFSDLIEVDSDAESIVYA